MAVNHAVFTQEDRKEIDDLVLAIYQQQGTSLCAEGVIRKRYYIEKLYEKLFGKGERPYWMIGE